jgi:hypothetical protein
MFVWNATEAFLSQSAPEWYCTLASTKLSNTSLHTLLGASYGKNAHLIEHLIKKMPKNFMNAGKRRKIALMQKNCINAEKCRKIPKYRKM